MDFLLLASVALPGVVFGAGYIFAYNLPIMSTLGINLYQTVQLLVIAYIAVVAADQRAGPRRLGVAAAGVAEGRRRARTGPAR